MSKKYPPIIEMEEYMSEWDYDANSKENLNPKIISSHAATKVNWQCKVCGNQWKASPYYRVKKGCGCPKCAIQIRGNLKHRTELKRRGHLEDPALLQDWDSDANYPLTPEDFTPSSNEYAYWKCHVCGYKWKAKISNRVHGRNCPLCSNKVVVSGINDIATTHPDLAKEWHPTKNKPLEPTDVSYGQGKKVWWMCPQGHEYQATLLHRSSGTNCPRCNSGRQTSFAEQAVYYYVRQLYQDAISRFTADFLGRMELDIYIPSIKYAIEYDGIAWHGKDKLEREQRKYAICKEHGIKLVRLKENPRWEPLSETSDSAFLQENLYEEKNLQNGIQWVLSQIDFKHLGMQCHDVDLKRDRIRVLESFKQAEKVNSFAAQYPQLVSEWHPTKNGALSPYFFKPKSDTKVWWLCPNCGMEYQSTVGHRVDGTGCPKCGIKKSAAQKSKQVAMIDCHTGSVLRIFNSISEAGRELSINASNITGVCKGQRKKAGGYSWKYLTDE